MPRRKKPSAFHCPVEETLWVLGGKWKVLILHSLMTHPVMRFNEMQRELQGVSPQMLAAQLRELEEDHILHRRVYPQVPPKVEYRLTDVGHTLKPVIVAMKKWGLAYGLKTAAVRKHPASDETLKASQRHSAVTRSTR